MIKPNSITESDCEEIWKPVRGFEGIYSVSNLGRVRRDAPANSTYAGRILTPAPLKSKRYIRVCLSKNGVCFTRKVHHLVLEAFVGERPLGYQVDHIKAIPEDNRLSEIEYVTPEENRKRAMDLGRYPRGANNPNSKLTEIEVLTIRQRLNRCVKGTKTQLIRILAREYQVSTQLIQLIHYRRIWKQLP